MCDTYVWHIYDIYFCCVRFLFLFFFRYKRLFKVAYVCYITSFQCLSCTLIVLCLTDFLSCIIHCLYQSVLPFTFSSIKIFKMKINEGVRWKRVTLSYTLFKAKIRTWKNIIKNTTNWVFIDNVLPPNKCIAKIKFFKNLPY